MITGKRIAIGIGSLALVVALVLWRRHGTDATGAAGTTTAATIAASPGTVARGIHTALDPRKLARGSVAGTIRDEAKTPIAGARVCLDGWSGALDEELRDPISLSTNAAGAYKAENLFAAHYSIDAVARTYRPATFHPDDDRHKTSFNLAAGETKTGVDIVLHAGGAEVTGTVSDISGGPIAHARVRASSRPSPPVETDDKGMFSMWTSPGTVRLSAEADGYATTSEATGKAPGVIDLLLTPESGRAKEHYPPIVVAGIDVVDQTWQVEVGATVRGRVLGKSGQPIADAEVSAQTTGGDLRATTEWVTDRSQTDGSYELRGMKASAYKIAVHTQKAVSPPEDFPVEIPKGGANVEKDLVLEDGGTIKGVVVDAQGEGVGDVAVDALPLVDGYSNGDEITSDPNGEFVIPVVRAGDYRVVVRSGRGDQLRKPGTTDDDRQGEKVTVAVGKVATVKRT